MVMFVWSRDGNIIIRGKPNSKIHEIARPEQIKWLEEKLQNQMRVQREENTEDQKRRR